VKWIELVEANACVDLIHTSDVQTAEGNDFVRKFPCHIENVVVGDWCGIVWYLSSYDYAF
jgi:hypothetical protein